MCKTGYTRRATPAAPEGAPASSAAGTIAKFEVVYATSNDTLVYITVTYTSGNQSVRRILSELGVNIDDAVVERIE